MANNSKIVVNRKYTEINPRTCGHECCAPSHSYGPAVRSNWLIHFVVCGKGKFLTSRGEYALSRGDIFIIKPHEIIYYEADAGEPWEYIWISFDAGIRLPSLLAARDYVFAPYLEDIFKDAFYCHDSTEGNSGYEEHLTSLIWEMISRIRREAVISKAESAEEYVRRALSIMTAELSEGITAESVAKRLNLNRSYFTSLFTSVTGSSPGEHLKLLRMERAAALLVKGDFTVSVVGASVGYSDSFVFSRAFKRHFGISPSKYQKNFKKQRAVSHSSITE